MIFIPSEEKYELIKLKVRAMIAYGYLFIVLFACINVIGELHIGNLLWFFCKVITIFAVMYWVYTKFVLDKLIEKYNKIRKE